MQTAATSSGLIFLGELTSKGRELRQLNLIPSCLMDKDNQTLEQMFMEWKRGDETPDAMDFNHYLKVWEDLGSPSPALKLANTPAFYQASENPLFDIERVSYQNQAPERKLYKSGYEHYFNRLPILRDNDSLLEANISFSAQVMQRVAKDLQSDAYSYMNH